MLPYPPVVVHDSPQTACRLIAAEITILMAERSSAGRSTVLGLPSGKSPLPLYQEFVRLHRDESVSFRTVIVFIIDEFVGISPSHPQSNHSYMRRHLFDHIDIPPEQIHLPVSTGTDSDIPNHCDDFITSVSSAGGIDYQILGIGRTGHIGYNEPGTPVDARALCVKLDPITRLDVAPEFGGIDKVPEAAITMGCAALLEARRIALFAWGEKKAPIIQEAIEGPVRPEIAASLLRKHAAVTIHLDHGSASCLPPSMAGGGI